MVGPAKQATAIQPMVGSPPKAASPTRLTLVSKCSRLVNLHLKRGPHNLMTEELRLMSQSDGTQLILYCQ